MVARTWSQAGIHHEVKPLLLLPSSGVLFTLGDNGHLLSLPALIYYADNASEVLHELHPNIFGIFFQVGMYQPQLAQGGSLGKEKSIRLMSAAKAMFTVKGMLQAAGFSSCVQQCPVSDSLEGMQQSLSAPHTELEVKVLRHYCC